MTGRAGLSTGATFILAVIPILLLTLLDLCLPQPVCTTGILTTTADSLSHIPRYRSSPPFHDAILSRPTLLAATAHRHQFSSLQPPGSWSTVSQHQPAATRRRAVWIEVHDAGLHGNANPLNSYGPIAPALIQGKGPCIRMTLFGTEPIPDDQKIASYYKVIGHVSAYKSRALVPVETTPTGPLHPPMLTACPAAILYPLALGLCASAPLSSMSRTAA